MGNVISIFNQKGGTGKTTSTVNIATQMAMDGQKVLIIDSDPQSNLTEGLGFFEHDSMENLLDVFNASQPDIRDIIISFKEVDNLFLAPATNELSAVEISGEIGIEMVLKQALSSIINDYDYIFIDIPPSLGKLSMGALVASDYILVPVQAEYYPLRGIKSLMSSFKKIRNRLNPNLKLLGVFMTMYDQRTNISKAADDQVRTVFKDKVFDTRIRRNVALAESPSKGKPIFLYDKKSYGAVDYRNLAKEVDERVQKEVQSG